MNSTIGFSEDCIPHEIQKELFKIPEKTRLSFLAILANTWKRQQSTNQFTL